MGEKITQRNPEEPDTYVENIVLAEEMAIDGDSHESETARLRLHGERQLREALVRKPGEVRAIAAIAMNVIVPQINRQNILADQKYAELEGKPHDFASDALDALKATKR